MECSEKIRQKFIDAGVDVVVNADHTFLRFYPEEEYVLLPKGPKRIGGKIKLDEKAGFTCMVGAELDTSRLIPPFLKYLQQTNWYKCCNWNEEAPGRSAKVTSKRNIGLMLISQLSGWSFCSTKHTLAKRMD